MSIDLAGANALVTAASKGIGLATARRLLDAGANVAIAARDRAGLEAAVASVGPAADRLSTFAADLTDPDSVDAMLDEVLASYRHLDVAVLNTGGPTIGPVGAFTVDDWDRAYRLLLRPMVQMGTRVGNHMAVHGDGSIVFVTSTWVKQPKVGGALSATFRAGVSAFAKQLALELAPCGVRVNQVLPGATATDRMVDIVKANAARLGTTEDEQRAAVVADIPLGRWGEPGEIADAITFLASPMATFITGAALQVDGGAIRSTL